MESSTDAATLVAVYSGHADSVAGLAAAPDGQQFATGGWDGAIHVWRTGKLVLIYLWRTVADLNQSMSADSVAWLAAALTGSNSAPVVGRRHSHLTHRCNGAAEARLPLE